MEKSLIKNYLYNILFQILKVILPIFTVPYLLNHVGPKHLGISDYIGSVTSWFIIFALMGINIYGNRTIAAVRDDKEKLSKTFTEIFSLQVINLTICLILYILNIIFFIKEYHLFYLLHIGAFINSALDVSWALYGMELFKYASLRNIIVKLLIVLAIFTLVKTPNDLWVLMLIYAIGEFFGNLILFKELNKYLKFVKIDIKKAYLKHIPATLVLFIPTIAINIYTILDKTMLGYLIDDKSYVSLYNFSQNFIKIFLYFITSIGTIMLPRITNTLYSKKNSKEIMEKYLNTTLKLAIGLSLPMLVGIICVTSPFVLWYLPKQTYIGDLIIYSSPIILLISLSNVFGIQFMIPNGLNKAYSFSVTMGALINFLFNLILIPRLYALGATISSILAELSVTMIQYFFIYKKIKFKLSMDYLKYALASLVMALIIYPIGNFLSPRPLTTFIQCISGVISYAIILIITKESIMKTVLNKILKRGE